MILVCLLGLFVCSCANVHQALSYNAFQVILTISLLTLYVIFRVFYGHGSSFNLLCFVNSFILAFPSLQDVIAQKFGYPLLRNLPKTPELFHLINLESNDLTEILKFQIFGEF